MADTEKFTTVLTGSIQQPAYDNDNKRVNMISPAKVTVMGTATPVDLLLIIIAIYEYLERIDMIPREKAKAGVEQIERLLEESQNLKAELEG